MFKELMRKAFHGGFGCADTHSRFDAAEADRDFEEWYAEQKFEGVDVQERIAVALERIASAVVDPNDPYVRAHLNVSK